MQPRTDILNSSDALPSPYPLGKTPVTLLLPLRTPPLAKLAMANFAIDPTRFLRHGAVIEDGGPLRLQRAPVHLLGEPVRRHEDCALAVMDDWEDLAMEEDFAGVTHQISWYVQNHLNIQVEATSPHPHGIARFRFRSIWDRDSVINGNPHNIDGLSVRFIKLSEARNVRNAHYVREGWFMLLGFPVDYMAANHLAHACSTFGKMVHWHRDHTVSAYALVKCKYYNAQSVPRSLAVIRGSVSTIEAQSITVPVYILNSNPLGEALNDEDPLPPDNGNPHPFHNPLQQVPLIDNEHHNPEAQHDVDQEQEADQDPAANDPEQADPLVAEMGDPVWDAAAQELQGNAWPAWPEVLHPLPQNAQNAHNQDQQSLSSDSSFMTDSSSSSVHHQPNPGEGPELEVVLQQVQGSSLQSVPQQHAAPDAPVQLAANLYDLIMQQQVNAAQQGNQQLPHNHQHPLGEELLQQMLPLGQCVADNLTSPGHNTVSQSNGQGTTSHPAHNSSTAEIEFVKEAMLSILHQAYPQIAAAATGLSSIQLNLQLQMNFQSSEPSKQITVPIMHNTTDVSCLPTNPGHLQWTQLPLQARNSSGVQITEMVTETANTPATQTTSINCRTNNGRSTENRAQAMLTEYMNRTRASRLVKRTYYSKKKQRIATLSAALAHDETLNKENATRSRPETPVVDTELRRSPRIERGTEEFKADIGEGSSARRKQVAPSKSMPNSVAVESCRMLPEEVSEIPLDPAEEVSLASVTPSSND
ncbi:hypothetical protein ACP70R_014651 [Stipagrostis hirtigluma subsp. patula]